MDPDDEPTETSRPPDSEIRPGIDRRAAHADVALLGPEEGHICHCPSCGEPHGTVRREVLFSQRFSQNLSAALAGIGARALIRQPSRTLGGPGGPVSADRLAPLLSAVRRSLQPGARDRIEGDARRALDRPVVAGTDVGTLLDRLLANYQAACEAHPTSTATVTLVELMSGRPAQRGPLGPFAGSGDDWFERSSVVSVGKLRRQKYAGAHLLVRLLNGEEMFVLPSRQWPNDRAWLVELAAGIRASVCLGASYIEEWRPVPPAIHR